MHLLPSQPCPTPAPAHPAHLCSVVVEYPHCTDGDYLTHELAKVLSGHGTDEGDPLLSARLDHVNYKVVDTTWMGGEGRGGREGEGRGGEGGRG